MLLSATWGCSLEDSLLHLYFILTNAMLISEVMFSLLGRQLRLETVALLLSASVILVDDWVTWHGYIHYLIIHVSKHIHHILVSYYRSYSDFALGYWATSCQLISWLRVPDSYIHMLRLDSLISSPTKAFSKLVISSNDSFRFWSRVINLHSIRSNKHVVLSLSTHK